LNNWAASGFGFRTTTAIHVASTTAAVRGHEANVLALIFAGFAAIALAKAFWGLRQTTDAWRKGAEGEERIGRRLTKLEQHGFHVLHDLQVPGSHANVDHLVIGPTGLFVVDAKNYAGRLTLSKGTLWHGRYPLTKHLATTCWEAERVSQTLAVPVHGSAYCAKPVMCILGAEVPRTRFEIDGVLVISGGRRLVRDIRGGRVVMSDQEVADVTDRAERSLPPAAP
jgi:hypothetical protein